MITIKQGDCLEFMKDMKDNSVDFILTDIPYDEVNRDSNGLRKLDKGIADKLTFDLFSFLEKCYLTTSNSICIFCGREQFSDIYIDFLQIKKGQQDLLFGKKQTLVL